MTQPTRPIPTFERPVHAFGHGSIMTETARGRNTDGIAALRLTMAEANALHDRAMAECVPAGDEWAADVAARLDSQGRGRYTAATQRAWAAYCIASVIADLDAAEGILQAVIARA